jgi:acetylglutamate kinase
VKPEKKELGFVGIPNEIKTNILNEIIDANEIPVLAPIGLDENNQPHNINADIAAGALAKKLKSRRLLLMTDVKGVYNKDKKLISEITPNQAIQMMNEDVIFGGMIPKINTCIDAVNNGVRGVVIIDGRRPHSILYELFSDQGSGTLIRK